MEKSLAKLKLKINKIKIDKNNIGPDKTQF